MTAASIWATVLEFSKIAFLVLGEVFAAKKRAREQQEQWEMDAKQFELATALVMARIRAEAAKESTQAGKIEDELDHDLKVDKP